MVKFEGACIHEFTWGVLHGFYMVTYFHDHQYRCMLWDEFAFELDYDDNQLLRVRRPS